MRIRPLILLGCFFSAMLLASCSKMMPAVLPVQVQNSTLEDAFDTCPGGLIGTVSVGDLFVDSGRVAVGEEYNERHDMPLNVEEGVPTTVEGTCLGEDGQELGYARVERPMHASQAHGIFVYGPAHNPSAWLCLPAVAQRGSPPCIASPLLE